LSKGGSSEPPKPTPGNIPPGLVVLQ
jgi:hypothetical protein